jgi:hypothetical protein
VKLTKNAAIQEANRIFSAEQIEIHPDLPMILKEYSKVRRITHMGALSQPAPWF